MAAIAIVAGTAMYFFSNIFAPIFGTTVGSIGLAGAASTGIAGLLRKFVVPPSSMPPVRLNTVVRVAIGLNNHEIPDHPLENSGGTSPMIVAFDESQGYLGLSKWNKRRHINNGAYMDIEVVHLKDREKVQAPHLQILAQNEPLCIAYILETWSDETHRAWTGMQGPACGYKWGFSNLILGHLENGTAFKPFCTWIDGAHSKEIYPAALQIHMDDFFTSRDMDSRVFNDSSKFCNAPTMLFLDQHPYKFPRQFEFFWYPKAKKFPTPQLLTGQKKPYTAPPDLASLTQSPPASSTSTSNSSISSASPTTLAKREHSLAQDKRDLQKRDEALANLYPHNVVTSADPSHSAKLACTFPGYLGPDVVSLHEQLFCDTKTKTLWKLCQSDNSSLQDGVSDDEYDEGCYHKDELSLVKSGKLHKRTYVKSEIWELNGDILVDGVVVNTPVGL